MFEGLGSLLEVIADKNHSFLKRAGIVTIVFLVFVMVDNITGFTYYYGISHKLEGIEKIESLIKNDSINPAIKKDLQLIEHDLVRHQDLFSWLWSFSSLAMLSTNSINNQTATANTPSIISDRNLLFQFLSSGGLLISVAIFTLIHFFFGGPYTYDNFISVFLVAFVILFIAHLSNLALSYIPLIWDNAVWNYLLNLILQIGLIWAVDKFFYKVASKIKSKKNAEIKNS